MRLDLTLGSSIFSFTPPNDNGPYPFLVSVGTILIAARAGAAGFGGNETPSATAVLQNETQRVAKLIGNPLRAKAELYDGAELVFDGFVSAIKYGLSIELTLES